RPAGVRARARRARRRRQEAVEATRRRLDRRLPRAGLLRARADELPRAPRLELRRQDDDHVAPRADRAVLARARRAEPRDLRLPEARLDERRLPARARAGRVRVSPAPLAARAGDRLARGQGARDRAARAGEDREVLAVPRL